MQERPLVPTLPRGNAQWWPCKHSHAGAWERESRIQAKSPTSPCPISASSYKQNSTPTPTRPRFKQPSSRGRDSHKHPTPRPPCRSRALAANPPVEMRLPLVPTLPRGNAQWWPCKHSHAGGWEREAGAWEREIKFKPNHPPAPVP